VSGFEAGLLILDNEGVQHVAPENPVGFPLQGCGLFVELLGLGGGVVALYRERRERAADCIRRKSSSAVSRFLVMQNA